MSKEQQNIESNVETPVPDTAADETPAAAKGSDVPATPASPEEIAVLREQAAKADENWSRFVRLNADFDNFKKRAAKERLDAIKYANEALIERLLPVVDNFEAALAAGANADVTSMESLVMGVKMIAGQLKNVLGESGLEEIDAMGQPFDPNVHEALSQQPSTDVPEGQVLQQVRKGYRLKERLLRPAAVVVATTASAGETGSEA